MQKMKLIISILMLVTLLFNNLNAAESLTMSEDGASKSISSSCVNSDCTLSLSSGSQLSFKIENTSSDNLVLTKFEIIKTYNNTSVVVASTTDNVSLSGNTFDIGESVSLGYSLSSTQVANYWTGKYYLLDSSTGQNFTNSLKWDYNNTFSVIAENITEPELENPIADAGVNQSITNGENISLSASGSSDSDGTIVSYKWTENGTILSTEQSFNKSDFSNIKMNRIIQILLHP